MSMILCDKLDVYYDNHIALNDISFQVDEGDYLAILGENGSGKSSLIKSILGLVSPSKGKIEFNNIKSTQIGYLPQQTVVQKDFPASVFEIVLSGCLNSKGIFSFYSKNDKEKAKSNIKLFEIENIIKKSYRDLSGGQQQRVLLARALCATEKLLILDEPVTGLDPVVTAEFYSIINKLNKKYKITIIMVSHDVESSVRNANKIMHLDRTIKFYGDKKEYIKTNIYRKIIGGYKND